MTAPTRSDGDVVSSAKLLAYLQLLRIPNVFTALADVAMGFLVVHQTLTPLPPLLLLAAATACLYSAGMVLNDVYDYQIDLRERPHRPLPSGRISIGQARWLGYTLLVLGVACGWCAGVVAGPAAEVWWRSGVLATALASCVVLYDAVAKQTVVGPFFMGSCRFFNVLLGMSVATLGDSALFGFGPAHLAIAAGIGIYIVGVTWFARTEASMSNRMLLAWGVAVMLVGVVLLAVFPYFEGDSWSYRLEPFRVWPSLLCLLMFSVFWRCFQAVLDPQPRRVQLAVKHAILSLILLDSSITMLVAPWPLAIGVLALFLPTIWLGKWVYST